MLLISHWFPTARPADRIYGLNEADTAWGAGAMAAACGKDLSSVGGGLLAVVFGNALLQELNCQDYHGW